jgi:DNA replication protein DnaC
VGYTFDNYKVDDENRKAYQAALNFTNRKTGWLTLWGTYGPGKTHLLAAIANQLTKGGEGVIYYTLPDLLDKLRDSYKDDFSGTFHQVANVPVLLADEVDKVNPTLWALEKAYQLFDARYRLQGQIGTVFAMNSRPEVSDTEMDYLFSRMLDSRFEVIEVAGGDVRPVRE